MSQRCPVCKTKLWTDPLFSPRRLTCPRCGAVFAPTVAWSHFRILLVLVIILAMALIYLLSKRGLWLGLFVLFLLGLFWYLPRLISLYPIGPEWSPSEGVMEPEDFQLKLQDLQWEEKAEHLRETRRFRRLLYVLWGLLGILLAGLLFVLLQDRILPL